MWGRERAWSNITVLRGLDNAGKSTIVKRILNQPTASLTPTMGFEITSVPFGEHNLNIWDVGGQQTLRSFWFNYFDQLDALVWVIDASQLDRLHEVFRELYTVLQNERVHGVKLLILLNKIDLVNTGLEDLTSTVIKELELDSYGPREEKWQIIQCSAITGEGIHQGLEWLTS